MTSALDGGGGIGTTVMICYMIMNTAREVREGGCISKYFADIISGNPYRG